MDPAERLLVARKEIAATIVRFHSFLSTRIPPLRVEPAYDWDWDATSYRQSRPKGFPGSCAGVYLRYGRDGSLVYVGVATGCFDKRVWQSHQEWNDRWVDIIRVADEQMFLAPALEAFLIRELSPPYNRNWKQIISSETASGAGAASGDRPLAS